MKRTAQGASRWKRARPSSASGSRSIATSVPDGPRRRATRRACPPSPNVQSIAHWPGWGSSSSISSAARAGMWRACSPPRSRPVRRGAAGPLTRLKRPRLADVISSSVIDNGRDGGDAAQQGRLVRAPLALAPQLQPLAHAHDHDLLLEVRLLAQEGGDDHASGGVQFGVLRVPEKKTLQLRPARGERGQALERAPAVLVVLLRAPHPHARLLVDWH